MSKATDTGVFSLRNKTGEGWTKKNEPHKKAIEHFRENLPKDFRRYAYMPPEGYRCRRYDNVREGDVPRMGDTIALKGEILTVVAKDTVRFPMQGRHANVVNVLFYTEGKDPDTTCQPRFLWENWEVKKWKELQENDNA